MLTLFNTDRKLTRLAADAAHIAEAAGADEQPWRRGEADRHRRELRPDLRLPVEPPQPSVDRARAEHLVEVAVVGDPSGLADVLTPDAVGWSPTLQFSSRAEAETALRGCHTCLHILRFHVDHLWSSTFNLFAEWSAEMTSTGPLLVGDDVLIDADERRVFIVGASAISLLGDRISAIHTYFDDAAVIEQLLLGGEDS